LAKSNCKNEVGEFEPVINRNKCEGKSDCVEVCPYNVFSIGTLSKDQRKELNFVGKLKGFGHGWKQAFIQDPNVCRACGYCVTACPENAITLRRV